ncbi:hypothetical protein KOR34_43240 [Posidoniimonas corsicana]|uniref:VanZ like family protein n=1 Tax=Posidoniimonas corsicana TaxID=1938618 RepID=A0A5C5V2E5_9BACT|nr:hypothetical protein [Posidoniimonas corsicana]TWT32561.1 hypothetical protein KOR34_43240 [Posidoniimonas corsicana]
MRWILCAYLLISVALAVSADLGRYAPLINEVHSAPMGDKLLHTLFSGGLALLINCVLLGRRTGSPWAALGLGATIAAALCTLEEATNLLTPYRGAELSDLAANYLGILLLGTAPIAIYLLARRGPAPIRGA